MHQRGNQARSKADYYLKHLFIRILRHTLGSDDDEAGATTGTIVPSITRMPRSSSPDMMEREEERKEGMKAVKNGYAGRRAQAGRCERDRTVNQTRVGRFALLVMVSVTVYIVYGCSWDKAPSSRKRR